MGLPGTCPYMFVPLHPMHCLSLSVLTLSVLTLAGSCHGLHGPPTAMSDTHSMCAAGDDADSKVCEAGGGPARACSAHQAGSQRQL